MIKQWPEAARLLSDDRSFVEMDSRFSGKGFAMKQKTVCMLLLLLCFLLTACQSAEFSDVREAVPAEQPTASPAPLPTLDPQASAVDKKAFYRNAEERENRTVVFSADAGFYSKDVSLTLTAEGAADIYYTDDGSEPGPSSLSYTRPIVLSVTDASLPRAAVIHAVAYYADGTKSPVCSNTYFLNTKIKKRFSLPVFSIAGPPDELTSGPNAMLVGKRALDTGENAWRTVSLQLYLSDGTLALSQDATLRVYGSASRDMAVKSLQLIAGAGMEENGQTFDYAFFGTSNAQGQAMDRYRQLVLSSGEADFQYAFIRDELAQTLAKLMRLQDYEDVQPAVVYINGEYYGLHWLHEVYSNEFFQAVYGASNGRYAVIDWSNGAAAPLSASDAAAAAAFQETFGQVLAADLDTEEGTSLLQRFMDVENYLDYCALSLIIDNPNWPGQMQAYAYIPAEGDGQPSQWRFLPHDMGRSFGLKAGQDAAKADTLGEVLNPDSPRYAALFSKLMENREFRAYFVEKVTGLLDDQLSKDAMLSALKDLNSARNSEMQHYFSRLDALRKVRNSGVWMKKKDFDAAYSALTNYIKARPGAVRQQLAEHLPLETR